MGRIIFAMIIIGGVLGFLGIQEWRLSQVAKSEAQEISCATLAQDGPGDNAHVRLVDFDFTDQLVYRQKKGQSAWAVAYVPAIPKGRAVLPGPGNPGGPSTTIKIIVKSNKVRGEDDLYALTQGPLEGMVVNKIESLGGEEKKILQESYPGTNFATCWIIEHGRRPATSGKIFGFIGGGAALIAVGGFLLVARRNRE